MTARVLRLDHVQLAMPGGAHAEAAADGFYVGILGLTAMPKPAPLAARGGRWYATPDGEVQVHLGVEDGFRPARKAHPALVVDDLDELTDRIAAAGLAVRPDHELPGVRRSHVEDPFANRIELIASTSAPIVETQELAVEDGEVTDRGSWIYAWLRPGPTVEVLYVGATALPPAARTWAHLHDPDPAVGRVLARHGGVRTEAMAVMAFRLADGLVRAEVKAALVQLLAAEGLLAADWFGVPGGARRTLADDPSPAAAAAIVVQLSARFGSHA